MKALCLISAAGQAIIFANFGFAFVFVLVAGVGLASAWDMLMLMFVTIFSGLTAFVLIRVAFAGTEGMSE